LNILLTTIERLAFARVANAILEIGHDHPNLRFDSEHSIFDRKTMGNAVKEKQKQSKINIFSV
jgi:hypothetical protein